MGEPRRGDGGRGREEAVTMIRSLPNPPSIVRHASVTSVLVGDRTRGAYLEASKHSKRGRTSGVGGGGGGGEDIDKQSDGDCVRR